MSVVRATAAQAETAWTTIARGAERVGRIAGSGFLFSVFGLGAVILAAALLPAASLRARSREPEDLVTQRWISRAFALFIALGRWIRVWDVEASGFERLADRGVLIVANHPTLIDVVLLLARVPQCDCAVKRAAWSIPALAGIVRAAGYVPNDDAVAMIDTCVEQLRAGRSLLLFPEGSRSPDEGFRRFERGAAHVAIRAGRPVVPVFIDCQPPSLKKGQPWYALPNALMRFRLHAGEPIDVVHFVGANDPIGVSARRVNAAFLRHFQTELTRTRSGGAGRAAPSQPP